MQSRYAVESVDRAFRELLNIDEPFGGKLVIFGGDFRQTLLVVPGGTVLDQGEVCMIKSPLWANVFRFQLTENLRLINTDAETTQLNSEFYKWLLSVGSGSSQQDVSAEIELLYGSVFMDSSPEVVERKAISAVYTDLRLTAQWLITFPRDLFLRH